MMTAFGIEWTEDTDGRWSAEHDGAALTIKPGRGHAWRWFVRGSDWKADGNAPRLTDAQRFCALIAGVEDD